VEPQKAVSSPLHHYHQLWLRTREGFFDQLIGRAGHSFVKQSKRVAVFVGSSAALWQGSVAVAAERANPSRQLGFTRTST